MATARIPVELAVDSKKFRKDIDKISKVKLKLDDRGFRQPLGRIT